MQIENTANQVSRNERTPFNPKKLNNFTKVYGLLIAALLSNCKNRYDEAPKPDYSNFPDAAVSEKPDAKPIPINKLPPHDTYLSVGEIQNIINNQSLKKLLNAHGFDPFNIKFVPYLPDFSCTDPKRTPRLSFTTKNDKQVSVPIAIKNKDLKKRLRQRWKSLNCH